MLPWKLFIRSVGVATLLATAGLAAGQDVVPFSHVSRESSPDVVVDEPVFDVEDIPVVDEPVEETDAPDVVEPAEETPEIVEVLEAPEAPEAPKAPRAPKPAAPDQDDAAPAEAKVARPDKVRVKKEKGDHNCDGHFDNGWHRTDFAHPATGEKCTPGETAAKPAGKPAAKPAVADSKKGDRPETAPGQVKKAERAR